MDDWDDLKEWAEEECEDQVKEEQLWAVNTFMEHATQVAERRGQQGFTPVDSGKLMANTVVSVGRVDNQSYEIEDEDGIETRIKASMKASQAPAYSKIYIQNNASDDGRNYAVKADYKGWARTPAYRFFTLSEQTLYNEAEERN